MDKKYIETIFKNGLVNIDICNYFPSNNPQETSSFVMKMLNIENDLFITNEKLNELYNIHNELVVNYGNTNVDYIFQSRRICKYFKLCKEIIHDLRYTADIMVLMTSIASGYKRIDSIGDYNKKHDAGENWVYDQYCDYFKRLSQYDNASKHHYCADMIKDMNFDEPYICIVFCKDNFDYTNARTMYEPLIPIVEEFNDFYKCSLKTIKDLRLKNIEKL